MSIYNFNKMITATCLGIGSVLALATSFAYAPPKKIVEIVNKKYDDIIFFANNDRFFNSQ